MNVNPEKRLKRLEAARRGVLAVAANELAPAAFETWWAERLAALAPAERAMVVRAALGHATDEEVLADVRRRQAEERAAEIAARSGAR